MFRKKNTPAEKIPTKNLPPKFSLMIRVMVGAYLVYTSYSLIDGVVHGEGRDKYFLGAFMIAFGIIGVLLVLIAGMGLLNGRYVGGEMEAGEEEAPAAITESEPTPDEQTNPELAPPASGEDSPPEN